MEYFAKKKSHQPESFNFCRIVAMFDIVYAAAVYINFIGRAWFSYSSTNGIYV